MNLKSRQVWIGLGLSLVLPLSGCTFQRSEAGDTPVASPPAAAPATVVGPVAPVDPILAGDPNIFVKLAKRVVPSVVNISTAKLVRSTPIQGGPDEFFRRFFGGDFFGPDFSPGGPRAPSPRRTPREEKAVPRAMSLGTGFIVDSSGLILTNNHVVAGADEIKISFTEDATEKPTLGEVVGRDAELDVALIRVKGKKDLVPLPLGDSNTLEVGEYVVAVGNPFGQGHSVTHGIVSAKERTVPGLGAGMANYIQTDAPINPGNSGGPLINLKGEVIGINNAIDARAQGIGFAIPISTVKQILPQLKSKGTVERGYIGAMIGELTPEVAEMLGVDPELRAPLVTSVEPNGPADRGGMKPHDLVLKVNGKAVQNSSTLIAAITSIPVGETAKITVIRDGKERQLSVKIAKRPNGEVAERKKAPAPQSGQADIGGVVEEISPELAERYALPKGTAGVVVTEVDEGGPAAGARLMPGDVIVEVDRKPTPHVDDFFAIVKEGKSFLLRVRKGGAPAGREAYDVVVLNLKKK